MIERFSIHRDDAWYCAWPDVALHDGRRLVCVFAQCTHHGNRDQTRILCRHSDDRGATWSPARPVTRPTAGDPKLVPYWNCPRITALDDGRLAVVVDLITNDGISRVQQNHMFVSDDGGMTWGEPRRLPAEGIVPDRLIVLRHGAHAGRWLLSAHRREASPAISGQRLWWSDDRGTTWQGPVTIANEPGLFLCEGSLVELPGGELVCFMRENSFKGLDAYKAVSRDAGATWGPVTAFPLPGCHRPVAGLLDGNEVLITHRFMQGGQGWVGWWTQNTFAALTDVQSCLADERGQAHTRIMPLDFDRSPVSDCGYTGWVRLPDASIYVVNYCVDDAPKGQIRGYRFRREDLLLG